MIERRKNPVPASAFVGHLAVESGEAPFWEEAVRQAEQHFGVRTEKRLLGCGHSGCAAATTDGRVLKITTEVAEVIAMISALRARAFEGIAEVYGMPVKIGVGEAPDRIEVVAYVKERLITPANASLALQRALARLNQATIPAPGSGRDRYAAALVDVRDLAGPAGAGMVRSLEQLAQRGVFLWDLGEQNLGRRDDGSFAILDAHADVAGRKLPLHISGLKLPTTGEPSGVRPRAPRRGNPIVKKDERWWSTDKWRDFGASIEERDSIVGHLAEQVLPSDVDEEDFENEAESLRERMDPRVLYLAILDISPARRGRGLAGKTLLRVLDDARAMGIRQAWLFACHDEWTDTRTPTRIWQALGFEVVTEAIWGCSVMMRSTEITDEERRKYGRHPPVRHPNPAAPSVRGEEQGPSPLAYNHGGVVLRYALVETEPTPPPEKATYFVEESYLQRRSPKTGREWKEPKRVTVAGAKPGTVAFIDWHVCGPSCVYIDYLAVRRDQRGKKLATLVAAAFFETVLARIETTQVEWGDMMEPQIGTVKKAMEELYPQIRQHGRVRW